jgi:riboflavin kinase
MTVDVHLPDLSFVRKIEESFYINRGVYNTIDAWFYDNEFLDVTERRTHILNFLQYISANLTEEQSTKRLSFPDGLTNTLESYVERQGIGKKVFA